MTKYNKFSYKSKSAEERKQEIDNAMQLVEQGVKEFLTSEKYAAVLKELAQAFGKEKKNATKEK